jgi:hypothetical protein
VIYVANCEKCGLPLPNGAEYCPNCGATIRRRREIPIPIAAPTIKLLEAGLLGAFLAIMIGSFTPSGIKLYFLPSFVGALVSIFLFKTRRLDEAITIALAVYIFSDAIINVINIASLYFSNMSWIDLAGQMPEVYDELHQVPTLLDILIYAIDPVSAIAAAYIGLKITPKPHTMEPAPYPYGKRDEQGGIVYSVDNDKRKLSDHFPHKV